MFRITSMDVSPDFSLRSIFKIINFSNHFRQWTLSIISPRRDWPEIRKSEIPSSDFCSISGDWAELGIRNAYNEWIRMLLMKSYWMLQNVRVTVFNHFWVIKGKPTGYNYSLPSRLGLKTEIFAVRIFSNLVKLDNFQRSFSLKVRMWKLISAKEVFETHWRKLMKHSTFEFELVKCF